jgi:MtN3 and saliva related transmembrane protein
MNWITVAGTIAAICTTSSFLPQAVKTITTKDTASISLAMYLLFTFGTLMWLVFGIASDNWPVAIANAITLLLASVILFYKIKQTTRPAGK